METPYFIKNLCNYFGVVNFLSSLPLICQSIRKFKSADEENESKKEAVCLFSVYTLGFELNNRVNIYSWSVSYNSRTKQRNLAIWKKHE